MVEQPDKLSLPKQLLLPHTATIASLFIKTLQVKH